MILGWFVLQSAYMSLTTRLGIPPDELWHVGVIRFYADDGWDPLVADQTSNFELGDLERNSSYLYHYLLSFLYRLSPFGSGEGTVIALRFVNIAFGAATLLVLLRVMRYIAVPRLARNLTVFLMTSTMMFVFMSASVSYDNLFILLAAISFLGFFRLLERPDARAAALLFGTSLAMILTKQAAIPLAVLLCASVVVAYRARFGALLESTRRWWREERLAVVGTLLAVVLLAGLVAERYVGNVVSYGSPFVTCDRVHDVAKCDQNPVFRRDRLLDAEEVRTEELMPFSDFTVMWANEMRHRMFGIFGHKAAPGILPVRFGSFALGVLMVLAVARGLRRQDRLLRYGMAVGLLYLIVLMLENWRSYQARGLFGLALQGRYAFPVLGVLYASGFFYLLRLASSRRAQLALLACTGALFVGGALPAYLYITDGSWHRDGMSSFTAALHSVLDAFVP